MASSSSADRQNGRNPNFNELALLVAGALNARPGLVTTIERPPLLKSKIVEFRQFISDVVIGTTIEFVSAEVDVGDAAISRSSHEARSNVHYTVTTDRLLLKVTGMPFGALARINPRLDDSDLTSRIPYHPAPLSEVCFNQLRKVPVDSLWPKRQLLIEGPVIVGPPLAAASAFRSVGGTVESGNLELKCQKNLADEMSFFKLLSSSMLNRKQGTFTSLLNSSKAGGVSALLFGITDEGTVLGLHLLSSEFNESQFYQGLLAILNYKEAPLPAFENFISVHLELIPVAGSDATTFVRPRFFLLEQWTDKLTHQLVIENKQVAFRREGKALCVCCDDVVPADLGEFELAPEECPKVTSFAPRFVFKVAFKRTSILPCEFFLGLSKGDAAKSDGRAVYVPCLAPRYLDAFRMWLRLTSAAPPDSLFFERLHSDMYIHVLVGDIQQVQFFTSRAFRYVLATGDISEADDLLNNERYASNDTLAVVVLTQETLEFAVSTLIILRKELKGKIDVYVFVAMELFTSTFPLFSHELFHFLASSPETMQLHEVKVISPHWTVASSPLPTVVATDNIDLLGREYLSFSGKSNPACLELARAGYMVRTSQYSACLQSILQLLDANSTGLSIFEIQKITHRSGASSLLFMLVDCLLCMDKSPRSLLTTNIDDFSGPLLVYADEAENLTVQLATLRRRVDPTLLICVTTVELSGTHDLQHKRHLCNPILTRKDVEAFAATIGDRMPRSRSALAKAIELSNDIEYRHVYFLGLAASQGAFSSARSYLGSLWATLQQSRHEVPVIAACFVQAFSSSRMPITFALTPHGNVEAALPPEFARIRPAKDGFEMTITHPFLARLMLRIISNNHDLFKTPTQAHAASILDLYQRTLRFLKDLSPSHCLASLIAVFVARPEGQLFSPLVEYTFELMKPEASRWLSRTKQQKCCLIDHLIKKLGSDLDASHQGNLRILLTRIARHRHLKSPCKSLREAAIYNAETAVELLHSPLANHNLAITIAHLEHSNTKMMEKGLAAARIAIQQSSNVALDLQRRTFSGLLIYYPVLAAEFPHLLESNPQQQANLEAPLEWKAIAPDSEQSQAVQNRLPDWWDPLLAFSFIRKPNQGPFAPSSSAASSSSDVSC